MRAGKQTAVSVVYLLFGMIVGLLALALVSVFADTGARANSSLAEVIRRLGHAADDPLQTVWLISPFLASALLAYAIERRHGRRIGILAAAMIWAGQAYVFYRGYMALQQALSEGLWKDASLMEAFLPILGVFLVVVIALAYGAAMVMRHWRRR
jgi:hypothetical protein